MKIVAFGDSITEGKIGITPEQNWLFLLGKKLGPGFELFNAGVGGNSAREAMARYEKDVLARHPDAILLEFGGNNNDPRNPQRRVDDAEFKRHLLDFRSRLPENCKVVMITFPPIIDEQHAWRDLIPGGKLDERLQSQRQIVRDFAAENRWPLLDLYKLMRDRRYELILPDGVHLNPAGQVFFSEAVYQLIKQEGWLEQ